MISDIRLPVNKTEKSPACELPYITVVMPVRNEAAFIEKSLGSIFNQDYPHDRIEILIADGQSSDNTRTLISRLAANQTIPVTVLDNPGRIVPTGMNIAIRESRGEIIVRVDGHTIVEPDYVRQCVNILERTGADNVGGPMRAVGVSFIAKGIILATSTPFGLGNSAFHYSDREQSVDTVYMGSFRRDALFKAGLFDEKFIRHQDYELNYRIRKNGGKIFLSPLIRSHYYVRDSLKKLLKQYFQYGYWKGRLLRRDPDSFKWRHLVPPLFVLTLILGVLSAALSVGGILLLALPVIGYCIFLGIASLAVGRFNNLKYALILPVIFACIHLSWGIGVWCGLLAPKLKGLAGNTRD